MSLIKGGIQTFCGIGGFIEVWHGQGIIPEAVVVECDRPDSIVSVRTRSMNTFSIVIYNQEGNTLPYKTQIDLTWSLVMPKEREYFRDVL